MAKDYQYRVYFNPGANRLTIDGTNLYKAYLIPVTVDAACDKEDHTPATGFSDAVSAWSDCNRAEGHLFRLGDSVSDRVRGIPIWFYAPDLPALEKFHDGNDEKVELGERTGLQ